MSNPHESEDLAAKLAREKAAYEAAAAEARDEAAERQSGHLEEQQVHPGGSDAQPPTQPEEGGPGGTVNPRSRGDGV